MPQLPDKSRKATHTELEIIDSRPRKKPSGKFAIQRNFDPMKLTGRQRRFVMEYCVDGNGNAAARRAGYQGNVSVAVSKLLNNPVVKAAIAKRQMYLAKDLTVKSKDVLKQLIYALTRDAMDFCDKETGQMITDIRRLPPRARACIDGVEQEVTVLHDSKGQPIGQRVKTKLKLVPKAKAIEMAMEHKGLFKPNNGATEKVEVDWDAISQDNQSNPIDEIIADPMKYLTARAKAVEARVVEPSTFGTEE